MSILFDLLLWIIVVITAKLLSVSLIQCLEFHFKHAIIIFLHYITTF
jgi:hypothetical protein